MTHEEIAEALGWHEGLIRDTHPESFISRITALVAKAEAAERQSCAAIVRNADRYGCACSDRDALADAIESRAALPGLELMP